MKNEYDDLTEYEYKAPAYLKDEMMKKAAMMKISEPRKKEPLSAQLQLWIYSFKVGLAVLCTLLILFTATNLDMPNIQILKEETMITKELSEKFQAGNDKFTGFMNQLSNKLLNGGMQK